MAFHRHLTPTGFSSKVGALINFCLCSISHGWLSGMTVVGVDEPETDNTDTLISVCEFVVKGSDTMVLSSDGVIILFSVGSSNACVSSS